MGVTFFLAYIVKYCIVWPPLPHSLAVAYITYLEDCYGNRLPVATGYLFISARESAGMSCAWGRKKQVSSRGWGLPGSASKDTNNHWGFFLSWSEEPCAARGRVCPLLLLLLLLLFRWKDWKQTRIYRNGEPPLKDPGAALTNNRLVFFHLQTRFTFFVSGVSV